MADRLLGSGHLRDVDLRDSRPCRQSRLRSDRGGNGHPAMSQRFSFMYPLCLKPKSIFNQLHILAEHVLYTNHDAEAGSRRYQPRGPVTTTRHEDTAQSRSRIIRREVDTSQGDTKPTNTQTHHPKARGTRQQESLQTRDARQTGDTSCRHSRSHKVRWT